MFNVGMMCNNSIIPHNQVSIVCYIMMPHMCNDAYLKCLTIVSGSFLRL